MLSRPPADLPEMESVPADADSDERITGNNWVDKKDALGDPVGTTAEATAPPSGLVVLAPGDEELDAHADAATLALPSFLPN